MRFEPKFRESHLFCDTLLRLTSDTRTEPVKQVAHAKLLTRISRPCCSLYENWRNLQINRLVSKKSSLLGRGWRTNGRDWKSLSPFLLFRPPHPSEFSFSLFYLFVRYLRRESISQDKGSLIFVLLHLRFDIYSQKFKHYYRPVTPPLVFAGRVVLAQELQKERTFYKRAWTWGSGIKGRKQSPPPLPLPPPPAPPLLACRPFPALISH